MLVVVLCAIHLALMLALTANWLTRDAALAGGETMHQQFAYQAAEPGLPLYGSLDLHTSPLWYTPLQFQIAGYLSRPFGYDLRVMRATVAAFGIGSFVLVALLARRFTGDWRAGLVAAGLLAGLPLTVPWFVVMEPNAGHVFFLLLAVWLLVRDEALSWRTVVLSSVSLFLCCWTKHTGLAYMLAGSFYLFCKSPRKGLVAAAVSFGLLAVFVAWYASRPGSTFLSGMLMHKDNPVNWGLFLSPVLFPEYMGRTGVLFALAMASVFSLGWVWRRWLTPMHVFLGATCIVGTVARMKYGSGPTQAIAFYGLLAAYGVAFLHEKMREGRLLPLLANTLMAVQALAVFHSNANQFITASDQARYEQVLDLLRTPDRKTYYNCFGFLNVLIGRPLVTGPSWSCWKDGRYDRSIYPALLRDYWGKDPMDIVIIDIPAEDNSWFLYERLNANYVPVQELPSTTVGDRFGTLRDKKIVLMRKDLVPQRPGGMPPRP